MASMSDFLDVDFSKTDKEIAEKLGVSLSTVARYRSILGLRKRSYAPKKAIDFSGIDLSKPVSEAAQEAGCNRHSVSLVRRKKGVARHRDIDFSYADWRKNNVELAKEYHCTPKTVWLARKRLGIPQLSRGAASHTQAENYSHVQTHCPPLELCQAIIRKYPSAPRTADALRVERGTKKPDWPAWCFLPMQGTSVVIIRNNSIARLTPDQATDLLLLAPALAWRPSQDIVRFDRTIYDALGKTPLADDVPDDIFLRLPSWCLYIELYENWHHGVFVYLDYDTAKKESALRMLFIPRETGIPMPIILPLGYGSISAGFAAFQAEVEKNIIRQSDVFRHLYAELSESMKDQETVEEVARTDALVQHVLSLTLYLCSENSEWKSEDTPDSAPHCAEPKKVKAGWRLFPPARPRIWTVGEETGIRIRSGHARGGEGAHTGKRPHIRRAHWHSYWTGRKVWKEGETPEPQKIMVKWIPPIPVAMKDEKL